MPDWVLDTFVRQGSRLYNEDHIHLLDADIGFLWARTGFVKASRLVLGQAEQVAFRAGGWQKARAEQQMVEWFGDIPDFLITLAADYCAECSDAEFCALVEHELYHIAQELDGFGALAFTRDGMPKLKLRGHDVEELSAWCVAMAPARTCSAWWQPRAAGPRWRKSTLRGPAEPVCSSRPD